MLQKMEKTFYDMGNFHVCNNGISSIRGEEILGQLPFHREYRSHNETHVGHICEIGEQDEIYGVTTIDWENSSWKSHQSSAHKGLCLLGFCVVPREDPSKSGFQQSLEESMESRLNSSGTSSQDSQRCSSVAKSMIY